jgi:N6-adenosine-specific RNA methylase IME4
MKWWPGWQTVRPLLDHPEGCWIWFWTPNFHMIKGVAFDVLERGLGIGVDDRVHFRTWRKNKIGRGKVLRGQTEQVLLCRIGNPPALNLTNQTTSLDGDVRKDSQKPDQFYIDVEALTPAPRYVEFFARRKLPDNWDGFGDQVGTLGETPAAPAIDWRAAHVVKKPRPLVNGGRPTSPAISSRSSPPRRPPARSPGGVDPQGKAAGELIGNVEWYRQRPISATAKPVEYSTLKKLGFVGAVTIYRIKSRVDVAHFQGRNRLRFWLIRVFRSAS